ncbi:vacuolar protein sorting-associated protein VTA1 homolog [Onthophagus taurus]|uniref:vacuolar protein sorting-associated protein VTA1 homolog n=1 Tax=Onthophagus taurus TaxID=166361 RepID=UPI000C2037D1|nr:vacuolar protein sorting-associated protein VTA1 homolog [Onthophagus taurus]
MGFPPVPPEVRSLSHFLKVADDHEQRNIVITYWARMYAVQSAMNALPGKRPPAVTELLLALMDWLEKTKSQHHDLEGITSEVCAQAMIEEHALKMFNFADECDKNSKFDKNVVKAFYTSGILFDTLNQFGEISEDIEQKRKYAKWRAAYIHNCLKEGLVPTPGNVTVILSPEDERYSGFVSKEELDRMKGILPPDSDANGFQPPASFLFEDRPRPFDSNSPSTSVPATPSSDVAGANVPSLPDVPSDSVFPQPVFPTVAPTLPPPTSGSVTLSPDSMEKAQRYCKLANSALTYDDVKTAIDNLQKALSLLQYGEEK